MPTAVRVLDGKGFKAAIADGGWLGPIKRSISGTFNGTVVHHIGNDWPWRPAQAVFMLYEFADHIGVSIRQSMFSFSTLVIPKSDVVHWGVLERRSIPVAMPSDRSSTIAGLLLYGPIGALVGASMDASADKMKGDKPVIGVSYRVDHAEHAIFLDFQFSAWYHKAHDFLDACLPGLLRE